MTAVDYGELQADGVRFERLYDATAEELWAALTDPEQLPGWLAHASRFELEPGGAVELRFEDTDVARGTVQELEPGRVLAFTWRSSEDPAESLVRVEVVPREHGVLLVLEHVRLAPEQRPGYAAGWHAHLDALGGRLERGREGVLERYRELLPEYREAAENR